MVDLVDRKPLIVAARPVPAALVDVDGRLDDVDIASILSIKSVGSAPASFLPYLAWETGVDVWNPAWTEDVQRSVIEASPTVKRHKGTRYAVEQALAAFGIATSLVEWWETAPKGRPYTFDVTAYATKRLTADMAAPFLSSELISDVYASILAAKRHSTAFTLRVAASFPAPVALAAVAVPKARLGLAMHPAPVSEQFSGALGIAPVGLVRSRVSASVHPGRVRELFAVAPGVAALATARIRISATMTASP